MTIWLDAQLPPSAAAWIQATARALSYSPSFFERSSLMTLSSSESRVGHASQDQPPGRRDQPLPAPARDQPGRLVSLGTGGAGQGQGREQADLPVDRLLGLPLVPRHGARELREPGDRGADERALRQHQGRPRGAARPRPDLHVGRAGDDRARRLADVGVPHARAQAVLRRHLFSAADSRGMAGFPRVLSSVHQAWQERRDEIIESAAEMTEQLRAFGTLPKGSGALDAKLLDQAARTTHAQLRPAPRRLRPRPQVSAPDGPQGARCGTTRAPATPRRCTSSGTRSTRWPAAASTTTSAAASPATRPTTAGWSLTSRRCSTTTRC